MAEERSYPIANITVDEYFRVRPLNRAKVDEYKEQKQAGDLFPAVVLWHESGSGKVYLVAGEHRLTADREIGREHILAIFMNFPSKANALEFAISDNAKHGLPFTTSERKELVERLLNESSERSDRHIARICHVDHKTVARARTRLETSGEIPQSTERVGADGVTRSLPEPKPRPTDDLPQPQIEFLQALAKLQSPPRDTDARDALRERGFISAHDTWYLIEITEAGRKWLEEHKLLPAKPEPQRPTEVTLRERFPLDTKVLVEGSDMVGVISDIGGVFRGMEGKVCVTRPNPNAPGVNMTHWVDAGKVTVVSEHDMLEEAMDEAERLRIENNLKNLELPPMTPAELRAMPSGSGAHRTPTLAIGDSVRNVHSGQRGTIVGFQGDGAFVEGANGKRLVGRANLVRDEVFAPPTSDDPVIDEWAGDTSGVGEPKAVPAAKPKYLTWHAAGKWHIKPPFADTTCCGLEFVGEATSSVYPTCETCIAVYNEKVGEDDRLADFNKPAATDNGADKPRTLDEIAPRPWSAQKGADRHFILDAKGKNLASTFFNGGIDAQVAGAICLAVNLRWDYRNMAVLEFLPNIRRILDFIENSFEGETDGLLADINKVQETLLRVRKIVVNQEMDAALKEKQPQPEAAP